MNCVLDVSGAFLVMNETEFAQELEKLISGSEKILAPDIYISEATNAAWKYARFEGLSTPLAEKLVANAIGLVDEFHDSLNLWRTAFTLGVTLEHPIYDCLYLALALENTCPLITRDKKLMLLAKRCNVPILI